MKSVRNITILICGIMLLGACSASRHPYAKRSRKKAACDCPKLGHMPQQELSDHYYWAL